MVALETTRTHMPPFPPKNKKLTERNVPNWLNLVKDNLVFAYE